MPFYRFEGMQSYRFNPKLSTADGPVLEGEYLYFRMVTKKAGTGAELHYHPNELLAFPLRGKVDCIVGKDRRIVAPGMLVHFPPFARHGFKATEDGDLKYLYIKDRTWTLKGTAADEKMPEGKAIIEGLGNCYYPMIDSLDAPSSSGSNARWIEGTYIAFGFVEAPAGHEEGEQRAAHERFAYILSGGLDAQVAGKKHKAKAGDVIHVPRGASWRWKVGKGGVVRYAAVRSTPRLEAYVKKHGAADNWRG
jgi:quercetin dioxygenase-like cupin family protein